MEKMSSRTTHAGPCSFDRGDIQGVDREDVIVRGVTWRRTWPPPVARAIVCVSLNDADRQPLGGRLLIEGRDVGRDVGDHPVPKPGTGGRVGVETRETKTLRLRRKPSPRQLWRDIFAATRRERDLVRNGTACLKCRARHCQLCGVPRWIGRADGDSILLRSGRHGWGGRQGARAGGGPESRDWVQYKSTGRWSRLNASERRAPQQHGRERPCLNIWNSPPPRTRPTTRWRMPGRGRRTHTTGRSVCYRPALTPRLSRTADALPGAHLAAASIGGITRRATDVITV